MSSLPQLLAETETPAPQTEATGTVPDAAAVDDESESEAEPEPSDWDKLTEEATRIEGFLDLYQNDKTGALHLVVDPDRFGQDFLIFQIIRDAPVDVGLFRGNHETERVVYLRRHFDRVDLLQRNLAYYFDPENPLARAADANITEALLYSFKIAAEHEEDGRLLIEWSPFLLSETLAGWKRPPGPWDRADGESFQLGSLKPEQSRVAEVKSYPLNTNFLTELVYFDPEPKQWPAGPYVTDPRSVVVEIQQSFVELPDNDYQPRRDDPRLGYFLVQTDDLTTADPVNYRDFITRWDLRKKQPGAALSEPVEPITFWIENTTPEEFRPLVEQGVLAWNEAFEKAGFKNALAVNVQPDDADWDAGDIRYNVLRWTSSPNPPFGGYGPSIADPRTGQILSADIMLEYVYMTNRLRQSEFFTEPVNAAAHAGHDPRHCSVAAHLQASRLAANAVLAAEGFPVEEQDRLLRQSLIHLVLHEVGHTLGLAHNFAASTYRDPDELRKPEITDSNTTASVMDYTPTNLPAHPEQRIDYTDYRPGVYDTWAIEYGYSEALADPQAEAERLDAILARSTEPGHRFGNDADNILTGLLGIDPRISHFDLSSDPLAWAEFALNRYGEAMLRLPEIYDEAGESHQAIRDGFQYLSLLYSNTARVIANQIGGIYIDRSMIGQEGAAEAPYTPVPEARQREALRLLRDYVFDPDLIEALPESLLRQLQPQRRGWSLAFQPPRTEDPKLHAGILSMQRRVLGHLLNPQTLQRIVDAALYGGTYTLAEYAEELTAALFEADRVGSINSLRQNLQLSYVERLGNLLGHDGIAPNLKSPFLYELQELEADLEERRSSDPATRAHNAHLLHQIDLILDPS